MTSTTVTVLVGLGGLVLGALTSGCVQAWLGWLDRRRTGRAAARLLYTYLLWAELAVNDALTLRSWNPKTPWDWFIAAWREQRLALAHVLPTESFRELAVAFGVIEQLAVIRAEDCKRTPPTFSSDPRFEGTYRADVKKAVAVVHLASLTWRERRNPPNEMTADPASSRSEEGRVLPSGEATPTEDAPPPNN
jgi:hypothetical protein